jgi:hypothetical protein
MKCVPELYKIVLISLLLLALSCKDNSTDPAPTCTPKTVPPDTGQYESIIILEPLGCEVYSPGDSIRIAWEYRQPEYDLHMVGVQLSLNNGLTFFHIIDRAVPTVGSQGDTGWVIPDSATYLTEEAIMQVYDYSFPAITDKSNTFSIRNP